MSIVEVSFISYDDNYDGNDDDNNDGDGGDNLELFEQLQYHYEQILTRNRQEDHTTIRSSSISISTSIVVVV